jgi:hypothetical protein
MFQFNLTLLPSNSAVRNEDVQAFTFSKISDVNILVQYKYMILFTWSNEIQKFRAFK